MRPVAQLNSSCSGDTLTSSCASEGLRGVRRNCECVLLSGYGKSGSKRLLRILDLSRITHCRNEPDALSRSPFRKMRPYPEAWVACVSNERLTAESWNEAIQWSAVRNGDRDFLPSPMKDHLHVTARRMGLMRLLASRRARTVLGTMFPPLRADEWLVPWWIASRRRLEQATLAIKVHGAPDMAVWVLKHQPECQVVHLIRHPGAVLHSWQIRHLAHHDRDAVRRINVERLQYITEMCPSWATRLGDVTELSAAEAELSYWCYVNESIAEAGRRGRYALIRDEDVALDATRVGRRLFAACRIPWDRRIEGALQRAAAGWRLRTAPWHELLEPSQAELVRKILSDTWLAELWEDEQVVSRIDYEWKGLGL